MKILIINQHRVDALGGSEIQCDIIANRLQSFGHDVTYFVMSPKKNEYTLPYRAVPVLGSSFTMWRKLLEAARPDIVYWRYNKKGIVPALFAAWTRGIPFVFSISHIRDVRTWTFAGEGPFERYLSAWRAATNWMQRIRALVAPQNVRYLLDRLRSASIKLSLRLLASGTVSNNDFSTNIPGRRKRIIRNSAIPTIVPFDWPRPFIVWVANIKKRKNPELFMRLANSLRDTNVDFLMVGAIQSDEYRFLETERPVSGNFHYLGKKTPFEVNGILARSLFLVHTCNPEGFPNNLIQAWMQGKPTISLYFDPNGFIEKYDLGRYSRTLEQMEGDVRQLLSDVRTREDLGRNALKFSKALFDPDTNVRALESFLYDTLKSQGITEDKEKQRISNSI